MTNSADVAGLSAAEVADRVRRGWVNRAPRSEWREYGRIVVRNLFTGFNAMVAPAAVTLFVLDDFRGSVAVSGMAILNTGLSLFQEIRAKIHLDQLRLLVESQARVVRDGQVVQIPSGDVVRDDCVRIQAGDTVVADGTLLVAQFLEIDEALLTGESDPVRHTVGERILSGSVCVAGEGIYRAEQVGAAALAYRLSVQARHYHPSNSPVTRVINRLIRWLSYTAIVLCLLHLSSYGYHDISQRDAVRMVASTITTMVPQGLVLSATISFIVGAVAMSRRGAVVQQLSAVETMAAIDVVCTDKTGTLTTNHLTLETLEPLNDDPEAARACLRAFASASIDRTNRNIAALRQALGAVEIEALDQVPFKSANRYSAVRVHLEGTPRLLVLGAFETLRKQFVATAPTADLEARIRALQHLGQRLLVLAEGPAETELAGKTQLPDVQLRPLVLVGLGDELRPGVGQVLEALYAQGIQFKVISGDNPETVQGTVRHLNLPLAQDPVVTGTELANSPERETLMRERNVFGRVTPEQKIEIVEVLKKQGRRVAMIGDGINDVLAIKRADLGIAMGSGTQASKTVSALVLEGDRFDLLPQTLEEGRTIMRNLRRSGKLFLVKNVYAFLLILAFHANIGIPFPFVPQQVTLMNWAVIGIPALAIAASRERSLQANQGSFFWELAGFALRTGIVFGIGSALLLWHGTQLFPGDVERQRSVFLSLLILLGITTLFRALREGEPTATQGDRTYQFLGLLAIPVYLLAMYVPVFARFFELTQLGIGDWLLVTAYMLPCWALTLLSDWVWRGRRQGHVGIQNGT